MLPEISEGGQGEAGRDRSSKKSLFFKHHLID